MIVDDDFGNIEFEQSARSKHIRVRITADGLKVSMPLHATQKEALTFINSKRPNILAKQFKLKQKKENHALELKVGAEIQTLSFKVSVLKVERENVFFALKDGQLIIEFPARANLQSDAAQRNCWNGINYFLRKEAKRLLPGRTNQLAAKYGFTFGDIKIQSSKSRWGSCSSTKSINFSYYLMLLPSHLVDYVILHELCHTIEMNHGDRFWALMDKVTNNCSKALRAELKQYNMPN